MSNDLTTAQAAVRMGISVEKVRDLCRSGELGGADKDDRGHWRIPTNAVDAWVAQNRQPTPPPPLPRNLPDASPDPIQDPNPDLDSNSDADPDPDPDPDPSEDSKHWTKSLQETSWFQIVLILGAFLAVCGIVSVVGDTLSLVETYESYVATTTPSPTLTLSPTITPSPTLTPSPTITPSPTATPLPFDLESENEVLIVIANFHYTEGIAHTEAHHEIRQAIEEKANDFDFTNLRVEIEPTLLRAESREEAEALGQQYDASMVIWGADSGVRVTVNFFNLKEPDFDAADVKITETARSQLAKPDAYSEFITQDLPGQVTFLSLFAVGQSYYIEETYQNAIEVIEVAVNSHPKDENSLEGLAEAYFRLGWLYQVPSENDEQAIANYDQALQLNPDDAFAYNNRGNARSDLGDLEGAIADYDQALQLNPDYAFAYNNRGNARWQLGDLEGAIADYDQVLQLYPDFAAAYNNRGNARRQLGDLEGAIADYDQALQLYPDFPLAYNYRAIVRFYLGDLEGTIADFDQALQLNPNYAEAYYHRGFVRQQLGDLEGAITDYDQALELNPDDAFAYNNRGMLALIRETWRER